MNHTFIGKWISDDLLTKREPRQVFHRQLERIDLPADDQENSHVLFRKMIELKKSPSEARIYITADDYYKLYINGRFVVQGPAPAYHFCYNYNEIDVTDYLCEGENVLAVHTYYQGLINRAWQSGDQTRVPRVFGVYLLSGLMWCETHHHWCETHQNRNRLFFMYKSREQVYVQEIAKFPDQCVSTAVTCETHQTRKLADSVLFGCSTQVISF